MSRPMRVEIDTPFLDRGTKLRLQDPEISRSFVPLEVVTSNRGILQGCAAGLYDDYEGKKGRAYLLGLHCRIRGQEFHCYLRPEGARSYTVYRVDRIGSLEA